MKESIFASEIKKACDQQRLYYYKIPDAFNMDRFSPPKPFDALISSKKQMTFVEFKQHKSHTAMSLSKIQGHQINGLLDAENKGHGKSFVIINIRYKKYNRAFAIPIQKLAWMLIHIGVEEKRKSITVKEIEQFTEIKRKPWFIMIGTPVNDPKSNIKFTNTRTKKIYIWDIDTWLTQVQNEDNHEA